MDLTILLNINKNVQLGYDLGEIKMKNLYKKTLFLVLLGSLNITAEQGVIAFTIPKSGTHLLLKLLSKLDYKNRPPIKGYSPCHLKLKKNQIDLIKPNCCFPSHAFATHENIQLTLNKSFKKIFIYRDPRDMVCSFANYMLKSKTNWTARHLPMEERIKTIIVSIGPATFSTEKKSPWNDPILKNILTIKEFYYSYLDWSNTPQLYTTQFEKLVGSKGGGNDITQKQEIKNICEYLELEVDEEKINSIANTLFGNTNTFLKGQIGSWKEYFTEEHKKLFKEVAGDLLIELGYEKDLNW